MVTDAASRRALIRSTDRARSWLSDNFFRRTNASGVPARRRLRPGESEQRITNQFAIFIGAGYIAYSVITIPYIVNTSHVTDAWWNVPAIPAVFISGALLAVVGLMGDARRTRRAVAVTVTIQLAAALTWPFAWNGDTIADVHGVWLTQFNAIPAMACAMIWRPTAVIAYLVAMLTASMVDNALARAPGFATPLLTDTAFTLAYMSVPALAAVAGMRTARILDLTRDATMNVARDAASSAAVEIERARFAALIHDGVMATLLAVARQGNSPPVARQAAGTVREFDLLAERDSDDDATRSTVLAMIRGAVSHMDRAMTVDVAPTHGGSADDAITYPRDAVRAVSAAAMEAVRNILRHTDPATTTRLMLIQVEPDSVAVTIRDDGGGFDPARTPENRLGITVSIIARMAAVDGGSAHVRSRPGHGTEVELLWRR